MLEGDADGDGKIGWEGKKVGGFRREEEERCISYSLRGDRDARPVFP